MRPAARRAVMASEFYGCRDSPDSGEQMPRGGELTLLFGGLGYRSQSISY